MKRITLLLSILTLVSACSILQKSSSSDSKYPLGDCHGALPLLKAGKKKILMPGNAGNQNEFANYPVIDELNENNSIWFSFVAEFDGEFYFSAKAEDEDSELRFIAFQTEPQRDICEDILNARAEIARFLIKDEYPSVALDKSRSRNTIYPIRMREGEEIFMILFSSSRKKHEIDMSFDFTPLKGADIGIAENQKVIDRREDHIPGNYRIHVRDKDTGEPVVGTIHIDGPSDITDVVVASDYYIQPQIGGIAKIHVGAKGYFFNDIIDTLKAPVNRKLVFEMEPLTSGRSLQISDIQFQPGTSEFVASADTKLKRLVELMEINEDLKIEIQGHVMEIGSGSSAGLKLSEARAEKVLDYLVENGISKRRMKAVGYGNQKPIYPEPKFSREEQANRRVEILVID